MAAAPRQRTRPDDDMRPSGAGAEVREVRGTTPSTTIERTLALVGDRWTILVLRAAFRGIHRFDGFCEELGIARPILTQRLRKLVDAGLLVKVPYQEHPPRFDYRLTDSGMALTPVLVALIRWGDAHLGDASTRTLLVHERCGTELVQGFWCDTCATVFGADAVRAVEP